MFQLEFDALVTRLAICLGKEEVMTEAKLGEERNMLQRLLSKYESGQIADYDEDEPRLLKHDSVAERCRRIKARITEIGRQLQEGRNA